MKYKFNKIERREILTEVEKSYGTKIAGTDQESDSEDLISLVHKMYNHVHYIEQETLIRLANTMDSNTIKQVMIKSLEKIESL